MGGVTLATIGYERAAMEDFLAALRLVFLLLQNSVLGLHFLLAHLLKMEVHETAIDQILKRSIPRDIPH